MKTKTSFHPAFPPVSCRYGAPMGRGDRNPEDGEPIGKLRLKRATMSACGAYDDGGAYWGIASPLWCLWSRSGLRRYVRAGTREQAMAKALGSVIHSPGCNALMTSPERAKELDALTP